MKKYLFLFITLFIGIISSEQAIVFAEKTAEIQAGIITASSGDIVDVPVNINSNPGIIAICLDITYDKKCLELSGVDDCKLFKSASFTSSGDLETLPFRIMWEDALAASDNVNTGKLAVLHFNVLDTAAEGLNEIKIGVEDNNTFNAELKDVHFETINGGIEIKKSSDKTDNIKTDNMKPDNSVKEISNNENVGYTNSDGKEIRYFMPLDKICKKVSEDFEMKTGEMPADTEVITQKDGNVSIVLKNRIGSTIDTYTIDAETGKGTNSRGEEVDLSSEKNISKIYLIICVTGVVSIFVIFLFIHKFSKKKNTPAP